MLLKELQDKKLISPPTWLPSNTQNLSIMGSMAYGVSDDSSDMDIYGWCIPPKETVFPHLAGHIEGFGRQKKRFNNWQQHHVIDPQAGNSGTNYDFSIHGIVDYFHLLMENNPNMIDSLFVPSNCILHSTHISNLVRENRKMFLHKGCYHKFRGYAFSELNKASGKNPEDGSKRALLREKYGMDTKFLYHVVRLASQAEQILVEGDLDLQEKGRREHMKAIRRGEIKEQDIRDWFTSKEKTLEKLYAESKLPYGPDEQAIKGLLMRCLEHHYGSLDKCVEDYSKAELALEEIKKVLERY
jgi:uncharacterized protein